MSNSGKTNLYDPWIPSKHSMGGNHTNHDTDNNVSQSLDSDCSNITNVIHSHESNKLQHPECPQIVTHAPVRIKHIADIIDNYDLSKDSHTLDIFLKRYLVRSNQSVHCVQKYILSIVNLLWYKEENIQRYAIGALVQTSTQLCEQNKEKYVYGHKILISCIIEKIFGLTIGIETEKYLDLVESHTEKPYSNFYYYISGHLINKHSLDSLTLKIVLRKIVDSYTIENYDINVPAMHLRLKRY